MATRRWCRNRIKKRRLSERSEFPTLPDFGASGVCSPRSGPPSSGSPSLAYFSWRRKRSRSAAGPRPGLVVRQAKPNCFIRQRKAAAKPPLTLLCSAANARRHCNACRTGETSKSSLPWGVAGNSARRPTRFLLRQKVGQKGGPYDGAPLRGVHAPPGTETGSVGNSLRSDSRRFFIRFSPWRRVAV